MTYRSEVRAEKPLLRHLSFLLRPIFTLNHRWAMARGLQSLELELGRRRGLDVPDPPGPVTALRSLSLLAVLVTSVSAAALMLLR